MLTREEEISRRAILGEVVRLIMQTPSVRDLGEPSLHTTIEGVQTLFQGYFTKQDIEDLKRQLDVYLGEHIPDDRDRRDLYDLLRVQAQSYHNGQYSRTG